MTMYVRADHGTLDYVREIMKEYRSDLEKEAVTVDVRWAIGDGEKAPLRMRGYPCQAIISITPLKMRVLGVADAIIDVDRANWSELDDEEKKALIDHELHHLELVPDEKEGGFKRDDHDRPKLQIRPHDWEVGGFSAIARRHGDKAGELKGLKAAFETVTQTTFPWG